MAPNSPQSPGLSEMLEGLPKYRASGAPCDFVLECDGIEFPVHKAVLCSRSTYFDRMCNGDFRVRRLRLFTRSFAFRPFHIYGEMLTRQ